MATSMVACHRFKAYRLRSPGGVVNPGPAGDGITAEDLAEMLSTLSHEAKLGPVISLPCSPEPMVIVGELSGFIGIDIGAGLVAPVGVQLGPTPGKAGR